ncbi:MAG: carbon storage regulator CsrA [Deltaproteobacteria bacterium]|jgi:flagellar assembly factor FliW|nr:carbon storage regulator CsrA [Deltaproteobacteria bacterium]
MLVLTRKTGQGINISNEIVITIKEIKGNQVRLGIEASSNFKIYRSEIYEQIKAENTQALNLSQETPKNLSNFANTQKIKFNSSRFGELEINPSAVIEFPFGLVGIPDAHQFVMLEYSSPFSWLHSIDHPDIAFVVINGAELEPQFDVQVLTADKDIDLRPNDEIALINVVTVRPNIQASTVNVKAPIVVNMRNKKAKQIIIDSTDLSINLPLF